MVGGAVARHVTREMRTVAIEVESRYNKCQTQEGYIGSNIYRRRYYTNGKMRGIATQHDLCERRHAVHLTTPPHYVSEGQTHTVWNRLLCIVQQLQTVNKQDQEVIFVHQGKHKLLVLTKNTPFAP